MWLVVVTNQGVPVQATLVANQDDVDSTMDKARQEWGLEHSCIVNVPTSPILAARNQASVSLTQMTAHTDAKKDPKYLGSVSRVSPVEAAGQERHWNFCPDCGCSWLAHVNGQANLTPEDWEPQPCTECGCKKALAL